VTTPRARLRLGLVGPTWPFRGGIAHHTTLLAEALAAQHDLRFYSFSRMYPQWLYPGESDREPGDTTLKTGLDQPLLDSMQPHSWLRVGRRLAAWKPDAVILPWWVAFWGPQLWVVSRMLRRAGVPVIFLCHNVLEHESASWKQRVTWRVLRAGSAFLCHSDDEVAALRRNLPGGTVRKIFHPTYAALSAGEAPPAPSDGPPQLLFFGFVRPYKGLDVLLEAMPAVHRATGATLRVVGEMWGDPEPLHAQVRRLGLDEVVNLELRYAGNDELPALFAASSIVVLPYRSATGCGPLQLAFGAGRAVVGSAVGSIAEVVQEGRSGLLVPPDDPEALAEALVRSLEPSTLATLTAGAAEAAEEFSWEAFVDILEGVVQDVATAPPHKRP
jgi:glycosyltransferase involved in cell wall biosynthesis